MTRSRRSAADTTPPTANLGELEQLVLLSLLRLGSDAYGAAVRREIEARSGRPVALTAAYTVLDRLEAKGMVRSTVAPATGARGGMRRKHFEIRPAGERALGVAYRRIQALADGLEERLAE
ncbi:MAG TPA: helix-turn-helix transcriptional regulator [Thermoanaerobaculia bacterium]|nr:helix-turn-helix transcriptional regulator [Thermoanaerobaculia bacterium]